MMPFIALLLLLFMPTIAVRSKHAKTMEDSFDLEEAVKTVHKMLSQYTRAPDDAPGVKELRDRGIGWVDPTPENIRRALIDAMDADRNRAEAEAAHQHDSDSDEGEDDDEDDEVAEGEEEEAGKEEVDASLPTSVQHIKSTKHPRNRDAVVKLVHPEL